MLGTQFNSIPIIIRTLEKILSLFLFIQDKLTGSLSFCGVADDDYPDPRGMGYPFNKKWKRSADSTVESIVAGLHHMKLSRFTIYRYKKDCFTAKEAEEIKAGDLVFAFQNWVDLLTL